MNTHTSMPADPRRLAQIAILADQREVRELQEIVAPAFPDLSVDAGVDLTFAVQAYRDHPVRLANDFAAALTAIMGDRLARMTAEYLALNLSEGGVQ